MTDHKFTDDEVIHHLDCYENLGYRWCGYAIALINRQKAEIERLQADIDGACVFLEEQHKKRTQEHKIQMEMLNKLQEQIPLAIARAKSEAITDFAERLKHTLVINNEENDVYFDYAYTLETIDTLVKEMTEEKTNEFPSESA